MTELDFKELYRTLQSEDGLKQMMLRPAFQNDKTGHQFSQAELIADVVNIMRMDTKRIAEQHGVDVSITKMTPERAADLLQGVAQGDDLGLIDIFDQIEDQRMRVLSALTDEDTVVDYAERKQQILYSVADDAEIPDGEEILNEN